MAANAVLPRPLLQRPPPPPPLLLCAGRAQRSSSRCGPCRLHASQSSEQQQTAPAAAQGGAHVANSVATPAGTFALGSFLSLRPDAVSAVAEAVEAITTRHGPGFEPMLAVVFAAAAYGDGLEEVVPALRQLLPSLRNVFGCTVRAGVVCGCLLACFAAFGRSRIFQCSRATPFTATVVSTVKQSD